MAKTVSKTIMVGLLGFTLLMLPAYGSAKDVTLTVVWHGGVCADMLLEIAKDWTEISDVTVEGALVGYGPAWHDKIASEFAAKGSGFDLACWDSQSIGEFAGRAHRTSQPLH
jgi:multiple sugar transport system substrate-binding protein